MARKYTIGNYQSAAFKQSLSEASTEEYRKAQARKNLERQASS